MSLQNGGIIGFKKKKKTLKKCKNGDCNDKLKQLSVSSFKYFAENSTVEFLGKGTYGKAFLMHLQSSADSPYIDLAGNPVKVLLVKVGFIESPTDMNSAVKNDIAFTNTQEFKVESQTQEIIFRSSLKKFNSALCPAIVYLDIVPAKSFETTYPLLYKEVEHNNVQYFSLIGMETFEQVDNVFNYGMSKQLQNTIFYMLLRLGALGYAHGDPGEKNVIVDKSNGRPYLIDFGNVQKLTSAETEFMRKQLVRMTDFEQVLHIILKGFPHGHPNMHNWDWLKYLQSATPLKKAEISKLLDKGWQRVL